MKKNSKPKIVCLTKGAGTKKDQRKNSLCMPSYPCGPGGPSCSPGPCGPCPPPCSPR